MSADPGLYSPARLQRESFAHFESLATRWADNDIYGHINNVAYYGYFDTVINRYLIDAGGLDIHHREVVGYAAESGCRFLRAGAYPQRLEAGLRVTRLGNSSVRYEIAIFADGEPEPLAAGFFVHVFVTTASGRPRAIPATLRTALQRIQR